ncbi:MAG: response regulator [Candidatus Omnitrophota bacterium]
MAKIMIVDDEQEILSLLELFLTKNGFQVVKCPGGRSAIETVTADKAIDLAVLDRRMPDVDGSVVLEEIRKLNRGIPVILLTGSLGDQTRDLEVDDFLMKPIDLNELLEKVKKLLKT